MSPFEEYPLDGVDLDQKIIDALGFSKPQSYQSEKAPSIRFSTYIPLDKNQDRIIELFAEGKLIGMPKDRDEYQPEEVKLTSGVMMQRTLRKTKTGERHTISQYIPEERFIEEFLTNPVAKIKVARWFAEYRAQVMFDEDTMDTINERFTPNITEDDHPFERVIH